MHAKILKVRPCNYLTDRIWNTSYTKLKRSTVNYIRQNVFRNLYIRFRRLRTLNIREVIMFTFDDKINLRYMNAFIITAAYLREMLIYLNYYDISHTRNRRRNTRIYREVKITMCIHRCNTYHNHIYMQEKFIVSRIIMENHRYIIAKSLIAESSLIR